MNRIRMTRRHLSLLAVGVLVVACTGKGPSQAKQAAVATPLPSPIPTAGGSSQGVWLMGVLLDVPKQCTLDCVADAVPWRGGLRCDESGGLVDYSGRFTSGHDVRFPPTSPTVDGQQHNGDLLVYWGTASDKSEYCVIVRPLPSASGGPVVAHQPSAWQFCTRSGDATVRARLRAVGQSARRASQGPSPCHVGVS
jgi:hypothetical protein